MNPFNYSRRNTSAVKIGNTIVGGNAPIRIQSMANTDTNDIAASVAQAERIVAAGGELVRFTTQGVREAQNLGRIRTELRHKGCCVPIVADVHFNANVAYEAAQLVEKVRINPGNFVTGKHGDYSNEEFEAEIEKIREKLHTLITLCKTHHTALRIGVNHGSLSPRIMSRYGDTPEGLAASCMEFLHLCEAEHFHDIVLSVKASNVRVMVQSVRLLAAEMDKAGMHYPLHLGVTEAGEGEDGRVKSAVGIGTLLADGLGDTVRVSLSEPPECEIPVAQKLVNYVTARAAHAHIDAQPTDGFDPLHFATRRTVAVNGIGGDNLPVVIADKDGQYTPKPDFVAGHNTPAMCELTLADLTSHVIGTLRAKPAVILLRSNHQNPVGEMRAFFHKLMAEKIDAPVVIARDYTEDDLESLQLKAAADLGPLFVDGLGNGIFITNQGNIPHEAVNSLAFGILQAARIRTSRTEYISCPSCGRTMFDLQATVAAIKAATAHLQGLKIAVMGCIVNGPGEMADADYGYVGAGKGKVSLYRRKECVERNIPASEAVAKLLALIEQDRQASIKNDKKIAAI